MSGTAYTAGPWRVEGPDDFPNPNVGMWSVEGRTNVCGHCTLHDATLIAAAPDMFEALTEWFDGLPLPVFDSEYELIQAGCNPAEARIIFKARAALAKARGASS